MLMSFYNSAILSWSLFYLGNSFDNPLPWNFCPVVKNPNVTGEQREREGHQGQGDRGTKAQVSPREGSEDQGQVLSKVVLKHLGPPRLLLPSDRAPPVLLVPHHPGSLRPH